MNQLIDLSVNGIYGIEYSDYNPNMNIIKEWKEEYKNIKFFMITRLKNTRSLDDKIKFCKRMSN